MDAATAAMTAGQAADAAASKAMMLMMGGGATAAAAAAAEAAAESESDRNFDMVFAEIEAEYPELFDVSGCGGCRCLPPFGLARSIVIREGYSRESRTL